MLRIIVEGELGQFLKYPCASCLALFRKDITESHIIVSDTEFHQKFLSLRIPEGTYSLGGLIADIRRLDCLETITTFYLLLVYRDEFQLREVTDIGLHSQPGSTYKRLTMMFHLIVCLAIHCEYMHFCYSVGRRNETVGLSHCSYGCG